MVHCHRSRRRRLHASSPDVHDHLTTWTVHHRDTFRPPGRRMSLPRLFATNIPYPPVVVRRTTLPLRTREPAASTVPVCDCHISRIRQRTLRSSQANHILLTQKESRNQVFPYVWRSIAGSTPATSQDSPSICVQNNLRVGTWHHKINGCVNFGGRVVSRRAPGIGAIARGIKG
jgi:hypothetical protein